MKTEVLQVNKTKSPNSEINEDELLSCNNPVGRKVKIKFNDAAIAIDPNWHPKQMENFKEFKVRLLKTILDNSTEGELLRNLVVRMYKGNGCWSLR